MDWQQITVHTTTMGADIVSQLLMDAGAAGTEIVDRYDVLSSNKKDGMWDMIDEKVLANMAEDVLVKAYFEADGSQTEKTHLAKQKLSVLKAEQMGFDMGSLNVDLQNVQDEDWKENWKKWYKPMHIGNRIVIKPTWEDYDEQPGDLVIHLDPGMAFSTGTHETTSMCIRMLERYVKPGDVCMDVGCGSGILALAAAKLGAGKCIAIDLDEQAVKAAEENVKANGLADVVQVEHGDLLEQESGSADVIVANIIADVICFLCRPAAGRLRENGVFICSGIIKEREEDVQRALMMAGYQLDQRMQEGEWVCLAAHR